MESDAAGLEEKPPPKEGRKQHVRQNCGPSAEISPEGPADEPIDHLYMDPVDEQRGAPELLHRAPAAYEAPPWGTLPEVGERQHQRDNPRTEKEKRRRRGPELRLLINGGEERR